MKKLLLTVALTVTSLYVFSADFPVYNPPDGAQAEEAVQSVQEDRKLKIGLLDDFTGIRRKKKETDIFLRIIPLAPRHTGLTTVSQPVLQWHINRDWSRSMIAFTINEAETDSDGQKPIAGFKFGGPSEKGVYRINLNHRKITLKPGIKYKWNMTAEYKGQTMTVGAKIEYREPAEALISELEKTQIQRLMFAYAEKGFWYDAISEAQNRINRDPGNAVLISQRDSLLSQIGIKLK
ncbi:MAG: DUF928 domain-containing protein [Desulfobacterales bacterium]|nr:DUF928 domain-containing protein [Desulfobacterales bacterium]